MSKKLLKTLLVAALILPLFAMNIAAKDSPTAPTGDVKIDGEDDNYNGSSIKTENDVTVIVTPYAKRNVLNDTSKFDLDGEDLVGDLEDANADLAAAKVLDEVKAKAKDKGISIDKINVVALFDMDTFVITDPVYILNGDLSYSVTLKCKDVTKDNFLALLHWTGAGWEVMNATAGNGTVSVTVTGNSSPFCIVIGGGNSVPNTAVRSALQAR